MVVRGSNTLRFGVTKPGFHRREVGWGAASFGLASLVAKPWSAGVKPAGPHKESVWTPIILIDRNPKIAALTPDWTDRTR